MIVADPYDAHMEPLGGGDSRDFPNYPGMAAIPQNTIDHPRRPAEVRVSLWCWWTAAALWLVGALVGMWLGSRLTPSVTYGTSFSSNYDSRTGQTVTTTEALRTGSTFALTIILLVAVVWVVLLLVLGAGRQWARVALTVFAVAGGVAAISEVAVVLTGAPGQSAGTVLGTATSSCAVLLTAAAVVSMYRHGAQWFFSRE